MTRGHPQRFTNPDRIAEAIIERVGTRIVLALPLGLGKANHVANALFARALERPDLSLTIYTALTLEVPRPQNELESRFMQPLKERFFEGYPELSYAEALRRGALPENVRVHEFFLAPGRWLHHSITQQDYQSVNYTHVFQALLRAGVNVLGQLISPDRNPLQETVSLSCNPDLSVDLLEIRNRGGLDLLSVGQVNRNLPFMGGEAVRPLSDFDLLLDAEEYHFPLYRVPQEPAGLVDHAIGLHVARLVPDGGTLQIGIGSIGDAISHALLLRQQDNAAFLRLLADLEADRDRAPRHTGVFAEGLYAASEMLVEGFLALLEAGVLRREVDGVVLHGGFFIGSPAFYRRLEQLPTALREKIGMMSISFINDLYGAEKKKRKARKGARFVNSAMLATLLGAVVSDGLENGQVVSGVGGQYNFVAMAFALKDARSVIALPATRTSKGRTASNIVWSYAHQTIPRHLRDMVVTEYGIADLRDKSDGEVVQAMLAIADARFQDELLASAKDAGKIAPGYRIPTSFRRNTPEYLAGKLLPARRDGLLPRFPLGSDYSPVEEQLVPALQLLGSCKGKKLPLLRLLLRNRRSAGAADALHPCLQRLGLEAPGSSQDRLYRALLLAALEEVEYR